MKCHAASPNSRRSGKVEALPALGWGPERLLFLNLWGHLFQDGESLLRIEKGFPPSTLPRPAPLATGQIWGRVKDLSIRREASDSQKCSQYLRKLFLYSVPEPGSTRLASLDSPLN